MNFLNKVLPENEVKRKWVSILATLSITTPLVLTGIYVLGQYGYALFILTPLFMGMAPAIIYGSKGGVSNGRAFEMGWMTLGIFTAGLILFAIEGLICIIMLSPIALLLVGAGSISGAALINGFKGKGPSTLLILIASIPVTAFVEKDREPELNAVVTSIEIAADPQTVWKNVIEFPQLEEPTEFIFKTGIAYPINARIDGKGVGAVRHCNFTTGSFVEPITVWDEGNLLKFDVQEQPAPMKELSFWDVDAPHLHDYFVSKRGQFKLTRLPNGNTLLEGTTWYYHNIKPTMYWQPWSEYIVHQIHNRVLQHIKKNSEK